MTDEVLMRLAEDVEPPVVRIHPNARVVDPSAPDVETLKEPANPLKVRAILLHELDVEAILSPFRDAAFRVEIPTRERCLFPSSMDRRLCQPAGGLDHPDVPLPLSIHPAATAELQEKILEHMQPADVRLGDPECPMDATVGPVTSRP